MNEFLSEYGLVIILVACFIPWWIQIYHKNKAKGLLQGMHEFFNQLIKQEEETTNGKEKNQSL